MANGILLYATYFRGNVVAWSTAAAGGIPAMTVEGRSFQRGSFSAIFEARSRNVE